MTRSDHAASTEQRQVGRSSITRNSGPHHQPGLRLNHASRAVAPRLSPCTALPAYLRPIHGAFKSSPPRSRQTSPRRRLGALRALATTAAPADTQSPTPLILTARFVCPEFKTQVGQELALVGDSPALGSWSADQAVRMVWAPGHSWSAEVAFPGEAAGKTLEFKVVVLDGPTCVWEPGPNRRLTLPKVSKVPKGPVVEAICAWGMEQQEGDVIDLTSSQEQLMVDCQVVVPLCGAEPQQQLVLVGSLPQLGRWRPQQGVRLWKAANNMWIGAVKLPVGKPMLGKLVLLDDRGGTVWEGGDDRSFKLDRPPSMSAAAHTTTLDPSSATTLDAQQDVQGADVAPEAVQSSAAGVAGSYLMICHWAQPGHQQIMYRTLLKGPAPVPLPDTLKTTCHFTVPHFTTHPGQHLVLVGSHPQLGSWDPAGGLQLAWQQGHAWQGQVELLPSEEVEVKVVFVDHGNYIWEPGPNRRVSLPDLMTNLRAGTLPAINWLQSQPPTDGGPIAANATVTTASTSAKPSAVVDAAAVEGASAVDSPVMAAVGAAAGASEQASQDFKVVGANSFITLVWGTPTTPAIVLPDYQTAADSTAAATPLTAEVKDGSGVGAEPATEVVEAEVVPGKKFKKSKTGTRGKKVEQVTVVVSQAGAESAAAVDQGLLRFLSFLVTNKLAADVWGAETTASVGAGTSNTPAAADRGTGTAGGAGGDAAGGGSGKPAAGVDAGTAVANNIVTGPGASRGLAAGAAAVGGAAGAALAVALGSAGTTAATGAAAAGAAGAVAAGMAAPVAAPVAMAVGGVAAAALAVRNLVTGKQQPMAAAGQPAENGTSTAELQKLAQLAEKLQGQVDDLQAHNAMLQAKLQDTQSQLVMVEQELSQQLAAAEERARLLSERSRSVTPDLAGRAAATEVSMALQRTQAELADLRKAHRLEVAGLQMELARAKQGHGGAPPETTGQPQAQQAKGRSSVERQMSPPPEQITALIDAIEAKHRMVEAELQTRVEELEQAVAQQASASAAEVLAIRGVADEQSVAVTELQQQAAELKAQVTDLEAQLVTAQAQQTALLQEQQELLQKAEATYQAQLQAQKQTLEGQVAETQAALNQQAEAQAALQKQLEAQTQQYQQQVAALEAQVEERQWVLEADMGRTEAVLAENELLKAQLEQERERAAATAAELVPQLQAEASAARVLAEQEVSELRMAFNAMLGDVKEAADRERKRLEAALTGLAVTYEARAADLRARATEEIRHTKAQADAQLQQLTAAHAAALMEVEAQLQSLTSVIDSSGTAGALSVAALATSTTAASDSAAASGSMILSNSVSLEATMGPATDADTANATGPIIATPANTAPAAMPDAGQPGDAGQLPAVSRAPLLPSGSTKGAGTTGRSAGGSEGAKSLVGSGLKGKLAALAQALQTSRTNRDAEQQAAGAALAEEREALQQGLAAAKDAVAAADMQRVAVQEHMAAETARLQAQLVQLRAQQALELERVTQEQQDILANVQARHSEQLAQVASEHVAAMEAVRQQHEAELKALKVAHKEEVLKMQQWETAVVADLQRQVESAHLRVQREKSKGEEEAERLRAQVQGLEAEMREAEAAWKQKSEAAMEELAARHAAEVAEVLRSQRLLQHQADVLQGQQTTAFSSLQRTLEHKAAKALSEQQDAHSQELSAVSDQLQQKEAAVQAADAALAQLKAEHSAQLQALEQQREGLVAELEQKLREAEALRDEAALQAKQALAAQEMSEKDASAARVLAEQEVSELRMAFNAMLGDVKEAAAEEQARLQATVAEEQARLQAAVAEEQARLQAAVVEEQARLQAAAAEEQARLQAAVAERETQVAGLLSELQAVGTRAAADAQALQETFTVKEQELKDTIVPLEADLAAAKAQAEALKVEQGQEVQGLNEQLQQLQDKHAAERLALESTLELVSQEARDALAKLEQRLAAASASYAKAALERDDLRDQLTYTATKVADLQQQLTQQQQLLAAAQQEVSAAQDASSRAAISAAAAAATAEAQVAQLQEALAAKRAEAEELASQLAATSLSPPPASAATTASPSPTRSLSNAEAPDTPRSASPSLPLARSPSMPGAGSVIRSVTAAKGTRGTTPATGLAATLVAGVSAILSGAGGSSRERSVQVSGGGTGTDAVSLGVVAELRQQVASLEAKTEALIQELQSKEQSMDALRAKYDSLSSEYDVTRAKLGSAETALAAAQLELTTLQREVKKTAASSSGAVAADVEPDALLVAARKAAAAAQVQVQQLQAAADSSAQQIRALELQLTEQQAAAVAERQQLLTELADARQQAAAAEAALAAAVAEQQRLQEALTASEQRAAAAEAALVAAKEQAAQLQQQLSRQEERDTAAAVALEAALVEKDRLEQQLAQLMATAASGDAAAQAQLAQLQTDVKTAQAAAAKAEADWQAAVDQVTQLDGQLKAVQAQLEAEKTQRVDAIAEADGLRAALQDVTERAVSAEAARDSAVSERTQLTALLDATERRAAEAADALALWERQAKEAAEKQGALRDQAVSMASKVQSLQEAHDRELQESKVLSEEQAATIKALAAELQSAQAASKERIGELELTLDKLGLELQQAQEAAVATADQVMEAKSQYEALASKASKAAAQKVDNLLGQVKTLQEELARVRAEEAVRYEAEALRLTRSFEARLGAERRLLLAARDNDVHAAVMKAKQEVAAILSSREQEIQMLRDRVEELEDELTSIKEAMSQGLGLIMPRSPTRKNLPSLPASSSPASLPSVTSASGATVEGASASYAAQQEGGQQQTLGKAIWSFFTGAPKVVAKESGNLETGLKGAGGSSNGNGVAQNGGKVESGNELARVASQDATQITAQVSKIAKDVITGASAGSTNGSNGNGMHAEGAAENGNGVYGAAENGSGWVNGVQKQGLDGKPEKQGQEGKLLTEDKVA